MADIRSNNKEQLIKKIYNIASMGVDCRHLRLWQYDKRQFLEKNSFQMDKSKMIP